MLSTGEPPFLFFLALVTTGEMTGLLQKLLAVLAAGIAVVAAVAATSAVVASQTPCSC